MNLGFVGSVQEWQLLQAQLDLDSTHRVIAIVTESTSTSNSEPRAGESWGGRPPAARRCSDFENLLCEAGLEGLVLGGPVSLRAERLRRIARDGRCCLCFLPVDLSAIFYYEAAMAAADSKGVLMPWLPGRRHTAWQELVKVCRYGFIGALRQVSIERTGTMQTGRPLVAASYAEAADLLSDLVGDITEVTATGDLDTGPLGVQHRSAGGVIGEIRLTRSTSNADRWRISVEGELGHAELLWSSGLSGPAVLHWSGPDGDHELALSAHEPKEGLLAEFARAVVGLPHCPTWSDAIRAAELADCAWQSLDRRRTVDVYNEKRNELASFKGRMTSLGCGLIWLTLLILIVIAGGKGLQIPGMDYLAAALAALWVAFLGMQALRWAFPMDRERAKK